MIHHASPGWRRGLGLHCLKGRRWSLVDRLKGLAPRAVCEAPQRLFIYTVVGIDV
jgi:hypothetical protein